MKFDTIRDATIHWVRRFNAIPVELIKKAYGDSGFDEFVELTPTKYYCRNCHAEFTEYEETGDYCPLCGSDDYEEVEVQDYLPMCGWMWTFEEKIDEDWARDNLQDLAKCGFRVYESDELGIVLGIDGIDYDFYESHWIPLYRARGLKWHKEDK